jgi:hypothetical protein
MVMFMVMVRRGRGAIQAGAETLGVASAHPEMG